MIFHRVDSARLKSIAGRFVGKLKMVICTYTTQTTFYSLSFNRYAISTMIKSHTKWQCHNTKIEVWMDPLTRRFAACTQFKCKLNWNDFVIMQTMIYPDLLLRSIDFYLLNSISATRDSLIIRDVYVCCSCTGKFRFHRNILCQLYSFQSLFEQI